ncbi:exodeoxyribonuclease I [Marinicella gelatinilytica]|uniref:exodeoxyribonuclease I n=1 Tax=Marinicella gelatinilytica TaxID=2996017 RepID=UPI002260D36B|nr:exodeoxyribonuclease I [Marinicella gelatinilytica]MCX7545046.1 exodeoxyribonuclease I [Marinicella gelatinilytica]
MKCDGSFYWYDLETFGIDTKYDRIAQFAGIRTDAELNMIGEPDMFYCQPTFDYLPTGESVLVTGITPQLCQQKGLPEHAFANRINEIFSKPKTCVVGYNSVRFDDECVRTLFYRNLMDPYAREYSHGNSRWDLIDLVRATYALRPQGIHWPLREDGQPSFRLEDLSQANGLSHRAAHDALSDVEATIQMAALIKQKQPRLFEFGLKMRDKQYVKGLLNWDLLQPVVHVSGMIPAERGCVSLYVPLAIDPRNKNGVICYDLNYSPDDLLHLTAEEIGERLYTPQHQLAEGHQRIHLKTIHINKIPFVAPVSILKHTDKARLGLDEASCARHLSHIKEYAKDNQQALIKKVQAVFSKPFELQSDDVDSHIYQGFFSYDERAYFNQIRDLKAEDIPWATDKMTVFNDARGPELVRRYRGRNFPESLDKKQRQQWLQECYQRLQQHHGDNWHRWFTHMATLKEGLDNADKMALLEAVEDYARNHPLLGLAGH